MSCSALVVGLPVAPGSVEAVTRQVLDWAARDESRTVLFANAHMLVEGHDRPALRAAIEGADLVCPDGMPLAWMLRLLGHAGQRRVAGPDVMVAVARAAAQAGLPVGLHGGGPGVVDEAAAALAARAPGLRIVWRHTPPFRPAGEAESDDVVARIAASGCRVLFVGLGCPKQELWLAAQRGHVPAVMLGVGAAFDFVAGRLPRAPRVLQDAGLEWAYRLAREPRRLLGRYARSNPRFVALALAQLAARALRRG